MGSWGKVGDWGLTVQKMVKAVGLGWSGDLQHMCPSFAHADSVAFKQICLRGMMQSEMRRPGW